VRISRNKIIILLLGILFCSGGIFLLVVTKFLPTNQTYSLTEPEKTVHVVMLTATGFQPQELVIRQGEKVIFNTDQDTPFWPASSLHPSHEIYPEFDPKGRIIPPDNWEFKFDKPGIWKYHDHINAHAIGVIQVIEPGENKHETNSLTLEYCAGLDLSRKQSCWDQLLTTVLKEKGVQEAFIFFTKLYNTDPEVPKACHEWGHALGKAAYAEYKETGNLVLTPETSYCGYGYYHSFIAELVKDTGDFDEVLKFCSKVENTLNGTLSSVHSNCVHGVGHGTTAWLLENPENWDKFQKTADEGTSICEKVYSEENDLEDCYDGVYNELHLDLFNDKYGMSFSKFMEKNDPFWLCQEQKDRHKQSCYFEFVGIFWKIFDMDLMSAIQYVVKNTDDLEHNGPKVISKIVADWIQFDIVNDSYERNIEACRAIPAFLLDSCIQGIANGFIQHGDPLNLHGKAFKFCRADYLTSDERSSCFMHFMGMLRWYYTKEKFIEVCNTLDSKDRPRECDSQTL